MNIFSSPVVFSFSRSYFSLAERSYLFSPGEKKRRKKKRKRVRRAGGVISNHKRDT
jgi:hypothetical protein